MAHAIGVATMCPLAFFPGSAPAFSSIVTALVSPRSAPAVSALTGFPSGTCAVPVACSPWRSSVSASSL